MPAEFSQYFKGVVGVAVRRLGILISGDTADDATAPTLTAGTGAPSASEANGSLYLRTNGLLYRRIGGAWEQVLSTTGALIANTISELTAAAGVTVDGCLIKDGRAALLATAAMFLSTEQTGTGVPQNVAHGFGAAPTLAFAIPSDLTGGPFTVAYGAHDGTNVIVTVTTGEKFRIVAFK